LKRQFVRPRRRWENKLIEIGWEDVDWIHLAEDSCENGNETSGSIKGWEFFD